MLQHKCFIQGRYILDYLIVVCEGVEWACIIRLDSIFYKIGFEKACDQLELSFILVSMKSLGFGPFLIRTFDAFFVDASPCFSINIRLIPWRRVMGFGKDVWICDEIRFSVGGSYTLLTYTWIQQQPLVKTNSWWEFKTQTI